MLWGYPEAGRHVGLLYSALSLQLWRETRNENSDRLLFCCFVSNLFPSTTDDREPQQPRLARRLQARQCPTFNKGEKMKATVLRIALCLTAVICLSSLTAFGQAASVRSDSDQTLKEILNEVRHLRADLLRLNVNAHRTQALLDRMKVQQEQVVRLTREVGNVRDELIAVRNRQIRVKDAIEAMEKQKAVGLGLAGEKELKALISEMEELKQREQVLVDREPLVSAELDSTRATLTELNARLDELEREIATPPATQPKKN
jgi:hypothetical protein